MYLFEIFDDGPLDMEGEIRDNLMDVLQPMVASHVPFVTIQQVVDKLRELRLGLSIDRGMIMHILDPNKIKLVDKIEGDRIYLSDPDSPLRNVDQDEKMKEKEHVNDLAANQAKKQIQK